MLCLQAKQGKADKAGKSDATPPGNGLNKAPATVAQEVARAPNTKAPKAAKAKAGKKGDEAEAGAAEKATPLLRGPAARKVKQPKAPSVGSLVGQQVTLNFDDFL